MRRFGWLVLLAMMAPIALGAQPASAPVAVPSGAQPAVLSADDVPWQQIQPGMRRKVWFNDRQTMVLFEETPPLSPAAADATVPTHHHPQSQMTYVLEGRARVRVGTQVRDIGAGGMYIAPSNVEHGMIPLTSKLVAMDVFTPTREDFRR